MKMKFCPYCSKPFRGLFLWTRMGFHISRIHSEISFTEMVREIRIRYKPKWWEF